MRDVLVIADHNAYHVGQMIQLRRILGAWPAQWRGNASFARSVSFDHRAHREHGGFVAI